MGLRMFKIKKEKNINNTVNGQRKQKILILKRGQG